MGDVPDPPHPLTPDELARFKRDIDQWDGVVGHVILRLVATVEAQATRLADAHNVIRRLLDGWEFLPAVDEWSDTWSHRDPDKLDDQPASPGEVDAIRQTRATPEETTP